MFFGLCLDAFLTEADLGAGSLRATSHPELDFFRQRVLLNSNPREGIRQLRRSGLDEIFLIFELKTKIEIFFTQGRIGKRQRERDRFF